MQKIVLFPLVKSEKLLSKYKLSFLCKTRWTVFVTPISAYGQMGNHPRNPTAKSEFA
jgi:hypothetical protein